MKHRNKNMPSPFPGQMSQEATKHGFSVLATVCDKNTSGDEIAKVNIFCETSYM